MVQVFGDGFVAGTRYSVRANKDFTSSVNACSKICVVPISALATTGKVDDIKIADITVNPDLIMLEGVNIWAELVSTPQLGPH